jgi:hypothetical protein
MIRYRATIGESFPACLIGYYLLGDRFTGKFDYDEMGNPNREEVRKFPSQRLVPTGKDE